MGRTSRSKSMAGAFSAARERDASEAAASSSEQHRPVVIRRIMVAGAQHTKVWTACQTQKASVRIHRRRLSFEHHGCAYGSFPLTPALSPGERGNGGPVCEQAERVR